MSARTERQKAAPIRLRMSARTERQKAAPTAGIA
jgi:hypothetical protein